MDKVNSLAEAMSWFMRNHSGSVTCVKDGKEQECNCYPDAIEFYGS